MTSTAFQHETRLPFDAGWRAGLKSYARTGFLYLGIVAANLGLIAIFLGVKRAPLVALSVASVIVAIVSTAYAMRVSSELEAQSRRRNEFKLALRADWLANITEIPRLEELPSQDVWFVQAELMLYRLVAEIADFQLILDAVVKYSLEDDPMPREAIESVANRLEVLRQRVDELRKYLLAAKASNAAGS